VRSSIVALFVRYAFIVANYRVRQLCLSI